MKNIFKVIIMGTLLIVSVSYAAKWNQLTGEELKALYQDTVMTGHHKGTKYTIHNCTDGRSFMKFGAADIKERVQTYPNGDEMCNEDDKGNRCYNIFQNAKKPHKLKFKGTNVSSSGKITITDKTPDWCT